MSEGVWLVCSKILVLKGMVLLLMIIVELGGILVFGWNYCCFLNL